MELLESFGPKIAKYKLPKEQTKSLYDICKPNDSPANKTLIGFLHEEYNIVESIVTLPFYPDIHQNMETYLKDVDCGFFDNAVMQLENCLQLDNAWYNKQAPLEYNPPHNHYPVADLVCVIFPKIELDDNAEHYTNYKQEKQLGQLHFKYGESGVNGFGTSTVSVQPEEGDMYVFPSTMVHYTSPIQGNSIRYSISCNYTFTNLAKRALSKYKS